MESLPTLQRSKKSPMSASELRKWITECTDEDTSNCELIEIHTTALDEEAPIERMALPLSTKRVESIQSQRAVLVLRLETEDTAAHKTRRMSSGSNSFFIYYLLCTCDKSTLLNTIIRDTIRLKHVKLAPKRRLPYVYNRSDSLPVNLLPFEKIVEYAKERLKQASKAIHAEDSTLCSIAQQLERLYADAQSDLLSVHLATACLSASYHLENRQKFAEAEAVLLYKRMLLRGVPESEASAASRAHKENIVEDMLTSTIHFMAKPLENRCYLSIIEQAMQAWSVS